MTRTRKVLITVVVVLVAVPFMALRLLSLVPGSDAAPRFTAADLSSLPTADTNLFVRFEGLTRNVSRPEFNRDVLESTSWNELKTRVDNGLNLDFEREGWASAEALDAALQPTERFVETCDTTGPCELLPVLYGFEWLVVRVLVLARRGELDAAESLMLRLRRTVDQWARAPRTVLGQAVARVLTLLIERAVQVLAVDDSPLSERVRAQPALCEPWAPPEHRDVLIHEAAHFHESMERAAGEKTAPYGVLDRRESQEMLDRCVERLLADPVAGCSFEGLDRLPNWLHNKLGRALAGSVIVALDDQMKRLAQDVDELEALQTKRSWCTTNTR
ncbi:MAG: hypothetical protein MUC96_13200 [Myxococcaceae bacterium]|jgi:hypothetical protein|nr:hypothetical protein [Myxococcaceae bacterium]